MSHCFAQGNRGAAEKSEILPLKGILVGNPLTDTAIDNMVRALLPVFHVLVLRYTFIWHFVMYRVRLTSGGTMR